MGRHIKGPFRPPAEWYRAHEALLEKVYSVLAAVSTRRKSAEALDSDAPAIAAELLQAREHHRLSTSARGQPYVVLGYVKTRQGIKELRLETPEALLPEIRTSQRMLRLVASRMMWKSEARSSGIGTEVTR